MGQLRGDRRPSANGGIGKIAALPSFENIYYFCRVLLVGKCVRAATSPIPWTLVTMAVHRSVRQAITPEKTGSQKPCSLEIFVTNFYLFCIIGKFMDICSLIKNNK